MNPQKDSTCCDECNFTCMKGMLSDCSCHQSKTPTKETVTKTVTAFTPESIPSPRCNCHCHHREEGRTCLTKDCLIDSCPHCAPPPSTAEGWRERFDEEFLDLIFGGLLTPLDKKKHVAVLNFITSERLRAKKEGEDSPLRWQEIFKRIAKREAKAKAEGAREAIDYVIAHSFVDRNFKHMRLINEKVLEAARSLKGEQKEV